MASALVPTLRNILAEMDPNIPLSDIATMEDMVGRSVGSARFITVLVSVFAGLALVSAVLLWLYDRWVRRPQPEPAAVIACR